MATLRRDVAGVCRRLARVSDPCWNKQHDYELAARYLDNAYQLAPQDARLLFERDLLDKLSGATPEKRLARLENNLEIALKRDDMTAELLNLWHLTGPGRTKRQTSRHAQIPPVGRRGREGHQSVYPQPVITRLAAS